MVLVHSLRCYSWINGQLPSIRSGLVEPADQWGLVRFRQVASVCLHVYCEHCWAVTWCVLLVTQFPSCKPSLYAQVRNVFVVLVGSLDNICACMCGMTCVLRGLRQPLLSDSWHAACLITGRGADSGQTAQCTHIPLRLQHSL